MTIILQITKSVFEEMKVFECVNFSRYNQNYGKTKTKVEIEEGAYKNYLQRRKDYIIISKSIFKKLVELKLVDLSDYSRDCLKTRENILLHKNIYSKYLKIIK